MGLVINSMLRKAFVSASLFVLLLTAAVGAQSTDIFGTARPGSAAVELTGLFLTWQRDPTTTMTIDWHFGPMVDVMIAPAALLAYKASDANEWQVVEGTVDVDTLETRSIQRVELTGLEPNVSYDFQMFGHDRVYNFRTLPVNLSRPVRFAAGGDNGTSDAFRQLNEAAMAYDLDFVVVGGDLAYANGVNHQRWHEWFQINLDTLITEEGRVVPMLLGIGNHEVQGGYSYNHAEYENTDEWREKIAPFYFNLFAFPGHPGYGVMDFGKYVSIYFLDTDHANPIEAQTEWLEQALAERVDVKNRIAVHHVPAYPSNRSYTGRVQTRVRDLLVPLYEQYGVQVAIENHDHLYKRTLPIRNNEPHPEGIVYIGDGSYGRGPRVSHDGATTWYLDQVASILHVAIVTLDENGQDYIMIDNSGNVIDRFDPTPVVRIEATQRAGKSPHEVTFTAKATAFDFDQFDKIEVGKDGFDYGAGIVSYEWDFGTGNARVQASEEVKATFTENGVYDIRVYVTDSFGHVGVSEPVTITVTEL